VVHRSDYNIYPFLVADFALSDDGKNANYLLSKGSSRPRHCFLHHFQAGIKADKKQTGVISALGTGHA
jgi:hypothetical protein